MKTSEKKQSWLDSMLEIIPRAMASRLSVFIFLFLFFYLVIYTLLCLIIPSLSPFSPGEKLQVVLGNYTDILSALGASIAAGSGVAIHAKVKKLHERHDQLRDSMDALHRKIDGLQKDAKEIETEQKKSEK